MTPGDGQSVTGSDGSVVQNGEKFELEAVEFIPRGDGEVILCKIRNVLQDESLSSDETVAQKLARIAPVRTTAKTYLGYDGRDMGAWGEPMEKLR